MPADPLLQVDAVSKRFKVNGRVLRAVEKVSFQMEPGHTLGVVGESGSGKSTLGRVALNLLPADEGRVLFQGQDLSKVPAKEMRALRRHMQIIFQNPLATLNPRMTIESAIDDAMVVQKIGASSADRRKRTEELLERVGLPRSVRNAYPFELSGGQQQRVGVARALSLSPKLVVCDEPISALDVSIQVQIIQLLRELQEELGIAYVFISHNLGVVQYLSDSVLVLYLGEVVEQTTAGQLFDGPRHPYTRALIHSVLKVPESVADRQLVAAPPGEIPSPLSPPSGCPYHPRCPLADARCSTEKPLLREVAPGHFASCHYADAPAETVAAGRVSADGVSAGGVSAGGLSGA